jgi:signal recognition particle subunit SRP68
MVGNAANALALIQHSAKLCDEAVAKAPGADGQPSTDTPPLHVDVGGGAIEFLRKLLDGELQRHRAIVHIDNLRKADKAPSSSSGGGGGRRAAKSPLVERLHEYPADGVDLTNIVEFPPKMALIPMKPILLDVAWNYIDYPGKTPPAAAVVPAAAAAAAGSSAGKPDEPSKEQAPQGKRGWFGFGRS